MTRKEQIAKKAARAAALATYKAILNPPVWKVAGTSFTASPTWQDIAKAAAAASYGAILKMAQELPKVPDMGKAPEPWGKVPDPSKDPIFGKDVGNVIMEAQPVDWTAVAVALQQKARPLYDWIVGGAQGNLSEPAKISAQEFANWVKTPAQGKFNWAKEERWPEIVDAIASNSGNPNLKSYLLSL